MAADEGKRGRRVEVPDWWIRRVTDATRGQSQTRIAEEIFVSEGWRPSQTALSKCLRGVLATLELVNAISDVSRARSSSQRPKRTRC